MKRKPLDPLLIVGISFLVLLAIFAFAMPAVRSAQIHALDAGVHDAVIDPANFAKPHMPPGGTFWLGTDEQGRDIVARLAAGAKVSLLVGFVVQIISLTLGITMGILGVYAPRWLSGPLMRLTDGMFAFPDILLAILVIAAMGQGLLPVIIALSVSSWPSIARLVKTQTATLKDREFVIAAKAAGAPTFYLVTRHILPQLLGLLLAVSMLEIAGTILSESTLSFLGIGVQAPQPSWGSMINTARLNMNSYLLPLIWPCGILSLTVFALNFVGDGLRTYLDPKS